MPRPNWSMPPLREILDPPLYTWNPCKRVISPSFIKEKKKATTVKLFISLCYLLYASRSGNQNFENTYRASRYDVGLVASHYEPLDRLHGENDFPNVQHCKYNGMIN